MQLKTVICDIQPDFRQGLRLILERAGITVVGEAESGASAMQLAEQLAPDTLIVEVNAKELNGFELSRKLRGSGLPTQTVVLALFEDETSVLELFRAGAKAYVNKASASTDLVPALRQLSRRKRFLSPGTVRHMVESYPSHKPERGSTLSAMETELLRMLAQDVSKNDISKKLAMSVEAVEESRKKIMECLNAVNNGALVRYAVRHGLQRS
jgi:DNA-binding NarL/FixJ family response regulator